MCVRITMRVNSMSVVESYMWHRKLTQAFRGIAISPVLSKVFEHCILHRFVSFFVTSENQFGFEKKSGCNYAIRSVRNIVDSCIKGVVQLTFVQ